MVRIYAMSESRYKSKFHYSDFATKTATLPPFRHVEMFWKPENFPWRPRFMGCVHDFRGSRFRLLPKVFCEKVPEKIGVMECALYSSDDGCLVHWWCVDKPTLVLLGIYVNSFYSISEQTMVSCCACIFCMANDDRYYFLHLFFLSFFFYLFLLVFCFLKSLSYFCSFINTFFLFSFFGKT